MLSNGLSALMLSWTLCADRFELAEMWKQCVWPCVYILDQRREARGTVVPPTEGSPLSARVWENKADPDESDVLKHILHINQSLFSALCIMPPFYILMKSLILLGSHEISSVCYNYNECSLLVWGQVKLMIGAMSTLGTGSGIIPSTAQDGWHSSHKWFPSFELTPWTLSVVAL